MKLQTYWITQPVRIKRQDNSFIIETYEGKKIPLPAYDIRSFVCFETVDINTQALALLDKNKICLHILSYSGKHIGSFDFSHEANSGLLHVKQAKKLGLKDAKEIILASMHNYNKNIETNINKKEEVKQSSNTQSLMGVEGQFKKTYITELDKKLKPEFRIGKRVTRPPNNIGNLIISFFNTLTYQEVDTAIRTTGLNRSIGFLHTTQQRQRPTLSLDLSEPFKPLFSDRLLIRISSLGMWKDKYAIVGENSIDLQKEGLDFLIQTFREEMDKKVYYKSYKRNVSYREIMYIECYKLINSLIDNKEYKAFKVWW